MLIHIRFSHILVKWLAVFSVLGLNSYCAAQSSSAANISSGALSSVPAEKPIYTSTTERDNALLVKAFSAIAKNDELQWLETPDEKFLTLHKAGETRKQKGILLIIHAPETPQLWPANLENVRRNLPISGWGTMALPLPAKYSGIIPDRDQTSRVLPESTSDASSSIANDTVTTSSSASSEIQKPVIARDKLIAARVGVAMAQINKLNESTVIALIDNSSAPDALTELFQKIDKATSRSKLDGPLKGLILVNLQEQEPLTKEQLSAIFSINNLPVMDVFFNPDNKFQAEIRRLHQAEAMRQNLKEYQQLILPTQQPSNIDDKQSFWLGKVHGFAEKSIAGKSSSQSSSATSNGTSK